MDPEWSLASAGQSLTGRDVITVPLPDSAMHAYNDGRVGAKLQFSKTGQDSIAADLVVYVADSSHHDAVSGLLDFNTFTGAYVYYDIGQNFRYAILVDSGTVVASTDSFNLLQISPEVLNRCEDEFEVTITYFEYVCGLFAFNSFSDCHWVKKTLTFWAGCGGGVTEPGDPPGGGEPGNNNNGGGPSNPNNVNTDYWLNYVQNFSTSFFDPNGTIELPEGFTAEQLQQLIELFHQLPLTPAEFHTLLNQVSFVSVMYQAYQLGSDPEWLKEVLAFAAAHGLTAGQFEFLILNGQVYAQVKSLTMTLGLLNAQVATLTDNLGLPSTIQSFLNSHSNDQHAIASAKSLLDLIKQGTFPAIGPDNYLDPALYAYFVINCAIVRTEHPDWASWQVYLEATWRCLSGVVHTALDICGLIPAGGEPCDLVNGVVYILEGNEVDAALSFAATIPIAGWSATGAKWCGISVIFDGIVHQLKVTKVGNLFTFGSRSDLRQVLNITNPNHEAHHIIPWDLSNRNIVQKAADSKSVPYHMNHHKNGMELEKYRIDTNPNGTHANHPQYNNQVLSKMDNLWDALETHYGVGNVPANVASTKLIQLQNSIANVITSYPTTKINLLDLSSVPIPVVP
jgi:hypothetical protein